MTHIKYTGIFSDCCMFIIYPGIGNGHVISSKLSHLSTKGNMFIGKGSILHKGKIVRKGRAKSFLYLSHSKVYGKGYRCYRVSPMSC